MSLYESPLVEGRIPANTVCPFRGACEIAAGGFCYHRGDQHDKSFSCALARGFDILAEYRQAPQSGPCNPQDPVVQ